MSSVENTRPGSFKGVPIRISEVTVKEGVKRAKYSFLNSKRRTQKPLLEWPPEFTVTGHTYGADGDSYAEARDRLRAALKTDEPGTYVDAWLGNNYCASDVYEFTQSYSQSNKCNFRITFSTYTDDSAVPQVSLESSTVNSVNSQALVASRSLQDATGSSMAGDTYGLVEQKKSFFINVELELSDTFSKIGETISQVSDYTESALELKEQAEFYANNPLLGVAKIADTIFGIDGLTTDAFAKFEACKELFIWGDNGENDNNVFISPTPVTTEDAQGFTNRETQKTYIQTSGLIEAYKQGVRSDYDTADEIDSVVVALEEQFEICRDNLNVRTTFPFSYSQLIEPAFYDAYVDLKELRKQALNVLNEQRKTAKKIEEITVADTPASVLSYRLYGDSQRDDEIMSLNGFYDNMSIKGKIKVYTDV